MSHKSSQKIPFYPIQYCIVVLLGSHSLWPSRSRKPPAESLGITGVGEDFITPWFFLDFFILNMMHSQILKRDDLTGKSMHLRIILFFPWTGTPGDEMIDSLQKLSCKVNFLHRQELWFLLWHTSEFTSGTANLIMIYPRTWLPQKAYAWLSLPVV